MKRSYLLLIFPLLLAFLLGSRMILAGDYFFLADQARDYLLAKDIILNNHLTLIGTHSGLGGFFHGPLWLYMLVPVYLIGAGDPLFFAYFYILLALITVFVGFIIGKKLYGFWIGVFVACILAISPSLWSYVPNTIGINVVPLVYLGIYYFFIKFMRGEDKALIFSIFFVGLTLQFETAAALVLIPIFILAVMLLKRDIVKNIRVVGLSSASFLLSISSFILFDLRHQFLMTKSLTQLFNGEPERGYMEFGDRAVSHLQSFKGVITSVNFSNHWLLFFIMIATIIFGFWVITNAKEKKEYFWEVITLLFIPVVMFGVFLKYPYPIYHDYVLGLTIPMALLLGMIVKNIWKYQIGKVLTIILISGNTLFALQHIINVYTQYQPSRSDGSYQNQKAVVDWIFQDSQKNEFGYYVYTPATYTYGMDYLFEWYGEKKGFIPKSEKMAITYLILYPPLQNDTDAHKFWKENVVRTKGKEVNRKEFIGGIIVEKLQIDPKEEPADPNYHQNLIFR